MKTRNVLLKIGVSIAPLFAALALGGPVTQAAATVIIVDDAFEADDCGSYNGKPSAIDPGTEMEESLDNTTIIICPGTYILDHPIYIPNRNKLTVKRATTGPGSQPILVIDSTAASGMHLENSSSITIDGVILDATLNTHASYVGLNLINSSVTLKNSGIIGPTLPASSTGIYASGLGQPTVRTIKISNSTLAGYASNGIYASGPVKLSVTSSHLDGTDGGRLASSQNGIFFNGNTVGQAAPTGSVTKSRVMNSTNGIVIVECSKVSITSNMLIDNRYGIFLGANSSAHNADMTKISGNNILGIPSNGYGIWILNSISATFSINKTAISGNVIAANDYTSNGSGPAGVYVDANVPATTMVTATISKNTFLGFPRTPSPLYVVNVNGNAGLKISGNEAIP
jgi:hypothetical protein